jgi:hypothetical protein
LRGEGVAPTTATQPRCAVGPPAPPREPAVMTLDRFAAKYGCEHHDLTFRALHGEALTEPEVTRLRVLDAVLDQLLPKPEPMPADVLEAVVEVKRLVGDAAPVPLPGAALLAVYPHVRWVEFESESGAALKVMPDGDGGWMAGDWGSGWTDHTTIDEALRDAEARAAKAEGRSGQ